ncbi:stage V sporulation protein AE [Alicyclobacillus sp.]|uniref:stage V sporulation protein AE n=1 Tax=Alicyclobacillus sp. TaxID=61169 RepID=UPI0025BBF29E|nr:stage V sporulation protein AE [Alicyclobacillus sp.]
MIVVTDGDDLARRALKMAARQLRARVISRSAGNPTPLSGEELVRWVGRARYDPVIVMFDDNGYGGRGDGERAMAALVRHPSIEVMGALAVASNTAWAEGVRVDFSVDCMRRRVAGAVDKDGYPTGEDTLYGDTVGSVRKLGIDLVVGIGDIGKMGGRDAPERASPVTTEALRLLMAEHRRRAAALTNAAGRA